MGQAKIRKANGTYPTNSGTPRPKSNNPDDELFRNLEEHPDAVIFQVRYGSATLNLGIPHKDILPAVNAVQAAFVKAGLVDPTKQREDAKNAIRSGIERNDHMKPASAEQIAQILAWLVFNTPGAVITPGTGAVVTITSIPTGGRPLFNFNTIVMAPQTGPEEDEPEEVRVRSESTGEGSPKSPHDRRGHWRQYQNGRKVWVRSCKIHGGA